MFEQEPKITSITEGENGLFCLYWSHLMEADKYSVSQKIPSVSGIYELYYEDEEKKLNLLTVAPAWLGGLRSQIREDIDSNDRKSDDLRQILENNKLYEQYNQSNNEYLLLKEDYNALNEQYRLHLQTNNYIKEYISQKEKQLLLEQQSHLYNEISQDISLYKVIVNNQKMIYDYHQTNNEYTRIKQLLNQRKIELLSLNKDFDDISLKYHQNDELKIKKDDLLIKINQLEDYLNKKKEYDLKIKEYTQLNQSYDLFNKQYGNLEVKYTTKIHDRIANVFALL